VASIPLPALGIQTPQQPDMLAKYGQLMQLRNAQQQNQLTQQEAPLRLQQLQQGVQSSGLQVQQQQIALKDQQAMTTAMNQWDGKSIDDLAPLVLKNGGSATAVMGLKQKSLEMRQKYSEIAKDDAATGASNIATLKNKNDMVSGALSTVLQVPDAQLPQALTTTAQQLANQGLLDPQHVQIAQQIAQTGDPNKIRQQLDLMRKGMLSHSQLLEEAQKTATTSKDTAEAAAKQSENAYYAKNGGAPGVPIEAQQQSDWLAKNPGKGPSDYVAWKAKQSPMALVMGNQLGGPQNGQPGNPALDFAADNYRKTGQMPPEISRSPGTVMAIIQRAAQMDQQAGGGGITSNKATLQANSESLKKLQTNFDQVSAFEGTAGKNLDLFINKLSNIKDLGVKFANTPLRMINEKMIGTDDYQAMKAAQQTAAAEAAKVLSSANASGVLSDTQKKEAEDMLSGNLSLSSAKKVVETLKQDFSNRHQSYQQQIKDIQDRIKGAGGSTPSSTQSDPLGIR
jgi:hypothetical protein